ncbi:MAG: hypothetical protein A6D91_04170 [Bacillaceae bacterium G1]|nr:MAG: hypothetical protein A6D91_04170 [Bacillaceae bacterium G1]
MHERGRSHKGEERGGNVRSDGYPVVLHIAGMPVTVVGGGRVAARKVEKLLAADARVTVISPQLHPKLAVWAEQGQIIWRPKRFAPEDILDARLVIAATDDPDVNRAVYEARQPHQWVNVVDRPDWCDFTVPATLRRGRLAISVSTGGASPELAKRITDELAERYDNVYADYVEFLARCRQEILHRVPERSRRQPLFAALLDPVFLQLTREGRWEERDRRFQALLNQSIYL